MELTVQRVGVSRSASIVIAYMMQYLKMGLVDAYLTCRARRLNGKFCPPAHRTVKLNSACSTCSSSCGIACAI